MRNAPGPAEQNLGPEIVTASPAIPVTAESEAAAVMTAAGDTDSAMGALAGFQRGTEMGPGYGTGAEMGEIYRQFEPSLPTATTPKRAETTPPPVVSASAEPTQDLGSETFHAARNTAAEGWNAAMAGREPMATTGATTTPRSEQYGVAGSEWKAGSMTITPGQSRGGERVREVAGAVQGRARAVGDRVRAGMQNERDAVRRQAEFTGGQVQRAGEAVQGAAGAVRGRVQEAMKPANLDNVVYGGTAGKMENQAGATGDGKTGERVRRVGEAVQGRARAVGDRVRAGVQNERDAVRRQAEFTSGQVGRAGEAVGGAASAVGRRVQEGVRHEARAVREQAEFTGGQVRRAGEAVQGGARAAGERVVRAVERLGRETEIPQGFPRKAERKAYAELIKANKNNPEQIQRSLEANLGSGKFQLREVLGRDGLPRRYDVIGPNNTLLRRMSPSEVTDTVLGAGARGASYRNRIARGEAIPLEEQTAFGRVGREVKAQLEVGDAYMGPIKGGKITFYGSDGRRLPLTMTPDEAQQHGFMNKGEGVTAAGQATAEAQSPVASRAGRVSETGATGTARATVAEAGGEAQTVTNERAAQTEAADEVRPRGEERRPVAEAPVLPASRPERFSMRKLNEYTIPELNNVLQELSVQQANIEAGIQMIANLPEERQEQLTPVRTILEAARDKNNEIIKKVTERRDQLVEEAGEQSEQDAQIEELIAAAEANPELTMDDLMGLFNQVGGGIGSSERGLGQTLSWIGRLVQLMSKVINAAT